MQKFMVVGALALIAGTAVAGGSYYERVARQALKVCLTDVKEQGFEIVAQEYTVSSCFAGGFITDVELYKVPRCNGPQCATVRLAAELVAAAQFGCDDELLYAECYLAPEPVFCSMEYAPVCGDDGQTYSNACFADAAHMGWTDGECGGSTTF